MTDISLQKTAKNSKASPWEAVSEGAVGQSCGAAARLLEPGDGAAEVLLDGEAMALTRKAVELALAGDQAALRALSRSHRRAAPRTGCRACAAADPRRRRHPGRD